MEYCTAKFCDHRHSHNILSHKYENEYIKYTNKVIDIPLDKQCNIDGCEHKETHTNEGHLCRGCDKYGHSFRTCTNPSANPKKIMELHPYETGKVYIYVGGAGGIIFHRRDDNGNISSYHIDCYYWYLKTEQEIKKLREPLLKFVDGYRPLRDCDKEKGGNPLYIYL